MKGGAIVHFASGQLGTDHEIIGGRCKEHNY